MLCPKCGAPVNEGDNFCEECGASLKQLSSTNSMADASKESFPQSEISVSDSELASVTNKGRKHPSNEDACAVAKCENGDRILIVADGVTSSVSAASGSQTAVDVIRKVLIKNDSPAKDLIISAIFQGDAAVKSLPFEQKDDGLYGPETTIVTAVVQGENAVIGWVGDSRAYVLNTEKQEQLTVDDSWMEIVISEGRMTREEAALDKRAHYVTQVLGMHDQKVEIHIKEHKLDQGDLLLLCTDGLWNYFQDENALLKAITAFGMNSEAVSICEHLTGLANAAGGHDNITAAIFKNLEGGALNEV
jgi:serine/threonine protein phosphatase PrpC